MNVFYSFGAIVVSLLVGCGNQGQNAAATPVLAVHDAGSEEEVLPPLVQAGIPIRGCPGKTGKAVVLTFDDGPSPYTKDLLDILAKENVRAAFFLKADNLDESHPASAANRLEVVRMRDEGHEICNHTFSHRRLPDLDDAGVMEEMTRAEALIADVTGRRTRCMRPPYSAYDDRVLGILRELDYGVVMADLDTMDWLHASTEFPADFDPEKVLGFVDEGLAGAEGPLIHIQHDNEYTQASVELVPLVLARFRAHGFEFVSLSECVGGRIDSPE
jgi:peptidoglycan-N-acetylglucosamine deacetylase